MYEIFFEYCKKSVAIIDRWALNFCVILLIMTVALNSIEIFTRYLLAYSSPYSMELAVNLSAAMYFIGYAVLMIRDEDVTMSLLFKKFKNKTQKIIDTAVNLLVLIFVFVLAVNTFKLFKLTSVMMHPVFPVKQNYMVVPLLLGSVIYLWISFYRLWTSFDDLLRSWLKS